MSREKPQAETLNKHPEEYQQDLNPNAMAGQNIGRDAAHPKKETRTAYDVKELHRGRLNGFQDEALKQIPVLETGARLEQGATYIDLSNPNLGEFTARGDMTAREGNFYVPKDDTPYWIWNQLIGVGNPEQLDTGNERQRRDD